MTAEPPSRQYRRGDAFNGLEPAAAPLPCACTHALGDARMIEVLDLLMGSTSSSGDGARTRLVIASLRLSGALIRGRPIVA